ncbi:right-handed parallel beta-helix repeat-containing protein [Hymenobacter sp. BT523]|uniref:right-handed parallel beta-helix repeat-containing protein n=1 Tax=Hymenobacter sp. BT523 TaxID=2795725 RepID=UPI0018ECA584|nr:right-handed parallel beta-helix repeat-containing protein [Hymenobacter sp. BT523]MBJ6111069.1 right-handed parallel beta-helix repeat-containing protein [Hymenobacter sp. BT523]
MRSTFILIQLLVLVGVLSARATTYYVNNAGDDANAGTSAAQAWRTPARVNATALLPGDRVLFAGGQTFVGSLRLRRSSQGTAAQPILFRSYGTGQALISSGADVGFSARNSAGVELRNLAFAGTGRLNNVTSGVYFFNDSTSANLQYLRFDSLDISGYRGVGLEVASYNGTSGYDNVRITNCQLHANGEGGLTSYAEFPLIGHHNWYVGYCNAYDNSGRPEINNAPTGNGIVVSGIDGVMVEHCTAYHNGWLNARPGGPAGIWGWDCNDLTIQYCESHHNQAGGHRDGGGFDLDGGCTNSVLQYNYSHDNDGPGYLLVQFYDARPMHDLVVRYNISENDARQQDQGSILVYSEPWLGGIVNADIYNNTIILNRPTNGSSPSAVYLLSGDISGFTVRNNILQADPGLCFVRTFTTTGVRFEGNNYWSPNGSMKFDWNTAQYSTLSAWRTASAQETLAGGTRATGMSVAPGFASTGAGAQAFLLDATSPLLGQGLNLLTEFGLNPGPRDFYGLPTPAATVPGNVGASEARLDITTPLPVELARFTAEPQGADAVLHWATASEKNNDRFEIEASADGRAFRRVGQVAGHGSSAQPHDYQFVDLGIARHGTSRVFYRLRQVDRDGTFSYSPLRTVAVSGAAGLALFPNPTTGSASLTGVQPGTVVTVSDAVGRPVLTTTADATGTAILALPRGLTAGVYVVRTGATALRLNVQ